MSKSGRQKKKPPIEASDDEFTFTFSYPSSSSSGLARQGEKKGHPQTPEKEKEKEKEKENQKPAKKTTKPTTTTDSIPSIPFPPLSPKQHLQKALESLKQTYKGLEKEGKEEEKNQVRQLWYYTQNILAGETPFIPGREQAEIALRGLVEEVKALQKEVAPIKETYAERLKKNLPSSLSSLSSLLLPSLTPSPSNRSSTSTRSKKKQLQERKLVLITDEKDQLLDTFSIRNKVN
jgi:hypothetical protein